VRGGDVRARRVVDIGGAFTDTVVVDEGGEVHSYKSPAVPEDPATGVLEAFVGEISLFAHGMTVAINTMLEDRGRGSV
jgi:N-methylhydantoinase A